MKIRRGRKVDFLNMEIHRLGEENTGPLAATRVGGLQRLECHSKLKADRYNRISKIDFNLYQAHAFEICIKTFEKKEVTIHTLPRLKCIRLVYERSSLPCINISVQIELTKKKRKKEIKQKMGVAIIDPTCINIGRLERTEPNLIHFTWGVGSIHTFKIDSSKGLI